MPSALIMCLALAGSVFCGAFVGVAYFQMKLKDPEKDGFYRVQKDLAEPVGLGGWAQAQRSKTARGVSFAVALVCFWGCLITAVWHGYLTFFAG